MSRLREPLDTTRAERIGLALGGLLLVAVGILALTLSVLPARWSLRRGLVAGALASPLLFLALGASYVGYTCARPEPWLDVRFRDEGRGTATLTHIANGVEPFTSSSGGDDPD